MSASHETFEYHLTPHGWVEGTEHLDGGGAIERPVPEDRVASFVEEQHMGSVYSKLSVTWHQTWPEGKVDLTALYKKFGEHPKDVRRRLKRYG